jgi:ribonuclease Z
MKGVESIGVKHCPNAYGIAFIHKDGWKITYSGDTMPCDNLVILGENSDVLIHEATMEDELKHEAVIKQHSTTSEAIQIGQRMKAKFVLLTHFSQRYAKVPIINEQFDDNVGIAFDNMSVRLKDLRKIPLFYPALKCMFADHCEEMEFKTQKKLKNREAELKA